MSVLELLDELESEVVRLCAERAQLAAALGDAEQRLRTSAGPPGAAAPRRKQPKRTARQRAEPPDKAIPQEPAEQKRDPLGKRVALGRGLRELRRPM